MKRLFLIMAALFGAVTAAHAATPSVTIPVGDYVSQFAAIALQVSPLVAIWLIRHLPAQYAHSLLAQHADQLLAKAIDYAVNSVAGAEKGKTLSVEVANPVLRMAVDYALGHGPDRLIKWMGGEKAIEEMIISRLSVDPGAHVIPDGNKSFVASNDAPEPPVAQQPATDPVPAQ